MFYNPFPNDGYELRKKRQSPPVRAASTQGATGLFTGLQAAVFLQELSWMSAADRWMCDHLHKSDVPSSSHMETSPADESLHRCDKYIGFVPWRRNNGQEK